MKRILSLILVVILVIPSFSYAATKEDVINAINATYQVGDSSFRLPQKYVNRGVAYLNSHPLTSEQYSRILGCIGAAVNYAREIGHVRYKEYTKEQINKGLQYVYAACAAAEVNLNEEAKKEEEPAPVSSTSATTSVDINANTEQTEKINKTDLHNSNDKLNDSGDIVEVNESTSGETSMSGEIQSGEAFEDPFDIDTYVEKLVYTEDDVDKEINQKLFIIYFLAFTILIVNILLIRLIFKKKWNKILKVTLIVLFVIISLILIAGICISLYYIEELKLIYKLYYLLY